MRLTKNLKQITFSVLVLLILACSFVMGCASAPRFTRKPSQTYLPPSQPQRPSPPATPATAPVHNKQSEPDFSTQAPQPKPVQNSDTSDKDQPLKTEKPTASFHARGKATYYANSFQGHKTTNGERYNRHALTAAHRTLPFGTRVRVTNTKNSKSVIVRINDRGPFTKNLLIDLSYAAAQEIDMIRAGVVLVDLETVP